ncbi:MAG: hypothetical protein ACI4V7_04040 [Succinivibrionaceae bacterium]
MLHVIINDNNDYLSLKDCLQSISDDDALLLLSKAVSVFKDIDSELCVEISQVKNLFVCRTDLIEQNIIRWYGVDIDCNGIISLIKKFGNPYTWK